MGYQANSWVDFLTHYNEKMVADLLDVAHTYPAPYDVILDVWSGSDNGQTSNVYRCRYDSDPAKPLRYVNSHLTEARLSRPRP